MSTTRLVTANQGVITDMKFVLITQAYLSVSEVRNDELFRAVNLNVSNPLIDKVHLMSEPKAKARYEKEIHPANASKVSYEIINRRCKYSDLIGKANRSFNQRNIILANTDIYFDATLNEFKKTDMNKKFFAITRLDPDPVERWKLFGGKNPEQTQDVWIFRSPVGINAPIELGTPGCENMFANAAVNAKLTVMNPALSVRCYHMHSSNIRSYTEQKDRVRGKYYFPPVSYINGEKEYVPDYCI